MKYEYQDIIKEELLNQKEKEIDKSTLKTATFNVFRYVFGQYIVNPEYKSQKDNPDIHIVKGEIFGVCNLQGSEYSIDFTVYEMDYPAEHENHILCHLNIN